MKTRDQICQISTVIDENIKRLEGNYGLMAQNVLSQLRNLVESVACALHKPADLYYEYDDIKRALKFVRGNKEYNFISKLYKHLEIVASHYTLDAINSEHLLYSLYAYLVRLKEIVKNRLDIDIFEYISSMVSSCDANGVCHYEDIFNLLDSYNLDFAQIDNRRLYVTHQRPIIINERVIYEAVLSQNKARNNKVDGVLVYSNFELPEYYAIRIKYIKRSIIVNGITVPITIVTNFNHAIYPKEFNELARILGCKIRINHNSLGYKRLMSVLDKTQASLLYVVENLDSLTIDKNEPIYKLLCYCKSFLMKNLSGEVILTYLLHTLNYGILHKQYRKEPCSRLSNLSLAFGCIPFEEMPYCSSLIGHNPSVFTLLECIDYHGREHEFLSRFLQNKSMRDNQLYVSFDELSQSANIPLLVSRFNARLYKTHQSRKIGIVSDDILFIEENETSLKKIIKILTSKCNIGIINYDAFVDDWLLKRADTIDSSEKSEILKKMFINAQLALIVGPAGTGKTTLIDYISELNEKYSIHYLANTNAAVENIQRKVPRSRGLCETAAKFLQQYRDKRFKCNILIIDECSTISNQLMLKLLDAVDCDCLVLVGDNFQLGAIEYGNWFDFAQKLLPSRVIHELKTIHRSANPDLLHLWKEVRTMDGHIRSHLGKVNASANFDNSVYQAFSDDEIILNLNYDGLYGINNLNAIMQGNNPNPPINRGVNVYKIGDPVIFLESKRFGNIFYNNLKGRIIDIQRQLSPSRITFDVEIDRVLTSMNQSVDENCYEIITYKKSSTIVRFDVFNPSAQEDEDSERCIVPFVVSYATSIHKSQGLEYNSVKIIITKDNIENITHDVFYTAITRAKEKLKIYWSKETEEFVIENLKTKDIGRDLCIFKSRLDFTLPS